MEILRRLLFPYLNSGASSAFAKNVALALKGHKVDICQAHDTFALLAARDLARKTGARIIYDAVEIPDDRSGKGHGARPAWIRKIETRRDERIIRRADAVIGVGPAQANWTTRRYHLPKQASVIRNCCFYNGHTREEVLRKDLSLSDHDILGLVIGTIYLNRGIEQLMEALLFMEERIHIAVVGPEGLRGYVDALKKQAERLGVSRRFHVLQPFPPSDLLKYASGADLGIIALQNSCLNHFYCLPNKLFECVMARLPVACSRLPDIEETVNRYRVGMVFDEVDPCDIARTIRNMLRPDTYAGFKHSLEVAARDLCWEREGSEYVRIVEQVAGTIPKRSSR